MVEIHEIVLIVMIDDIFIMIMRLSLCLYLRLCLIFIVATAKNEGKGNHGQCLNKKIRLFDQMATVVKDMVTSGSLGDVENQGCDCDEPDPVSNDNIEEPSNENSSKTKSNRKIRHGVNENNRCNQISEQLKEIAVSLKALKQDPDVAELYEVVMKTEGFDEEMLATAFDYLVQEEKLGRSFMAKNANLRKIWLENFFAKNDGQALKQGPDAAELYEVVMKIEGFDKEMLATAFDYLVQEEKVGRSFMAKNANLRKIWLENFFTKDDGQ